MNYYPRYMGDYQSDTMHLSMTEDGAYTRLLDHYYGKGKPLPGDLKQLCRIARALDKIEQDAVAAVADEFFPVGPDGLRHNARADTEIAKWQVMAERNREVGKTGGRPKKKPADNPSGSPEETQVVSAVNPTGNPDGNHDGSKKAHSGNPDVTQVGTQTITHKKPSPTPTPTPTLDPSPDEHSERAKEVALEPQRVREGKDLQADPAEGGIARIRAAYPQRAGRTDWDRAEHFCHVLIERHSQTWDGLEEAVKRYAAFSEATGATRTQHVMMPGNFFGAPDKPWSQPWGLPDPQSGKAAAPVLTWRPDPADDVEEPSRAIR